ncbi:TPA: YtxH domain-containing protein [Clostridioides difficile]|uniref:YtxH domain-containing protein n=1 Tax=Clostridioides difficile TaxID=1496 RepID=UPI0010258617|nr:YtxH domain-containing protein [Clostridioides difficile]VFE32813.1 Gas vesicle protein [Clostridioides difficile]VIH72788.1 Gas vesicle protein [Clostridioides difficile]VII67558.1 Gas vesicle protein [Clostridioides difficile]HBG8002343.1 YtxH domain-containing protein [Clostridioides difficile]HBG8041640.1 YtxH domain-containing protein [Clostridioides difficile]
MCNKRSCKKGGFLLLGAILGFIFGMFFAPKKGSELRKETKEKFNDVKERIINLVDDDNNEEDIKISEEDIVISKSFDDEGDVN